MEGSDRGREKGRGPAFVVCPYALGAIPTLFSDPGLLPAQSLKDAAIGSFQTFSRIVSRCQWEGVLPQIDTARPKGLIYAALHGAIDLELGGRASGSKGLGGTEATVDLLFHPLRPVELNEF